MRLRTVGIPLFFTLVAVSAAQRATAPPAPSPAPTKAGSDVTALALPGAAPDGVALDYLAVDRARHRVWVPAGGTGNTDVIDTGTQEIRRIEKFPTIQMERRGKKRMVGPSSATVGDGVVYVGNRADSSVCAVDATTLARGACVTLSSMPDGLAFVARTKEVWVTAPRDQSILILDVTTPATPKLAGSISKTETADGVDNIYCLPERRSISVAAAGAATLTVARLDERGTLQRAATSTTAKGARNAVVTSDEIVYVADGPEGKVLVVRPAGGR